MPHGKQFNDFERDRILASRTTGFSYRQIAKKLHRSASGIRDFINRRVSKRRTGRPPKLSITDKRRIIRTALNSEKSSNQIKSECSLPVCSRRIRRILNDCPYIQRRKLKKAPSLCRIDVQNRLNFAAENTERDWSKVSFSLL